MRLTVIVVLYKLKAEQSKTVKALLNSSLYEQAKNGNAQIILYDNSPEKQDLHFVENANISYVHDNRNLGIAVAYNYGWQQARENNSDWLLLLDHDTALTEEYVQRISEHKVTEFNLGAVMPRITCNGTMISPVFSDSLSPLKVKSPKIGVQLVPVMAINSGSLISVEFLNQVGGFNEQFPLDYLDHWLFYKIYQQGWKSEVIDVTLEHDLSVMNYNQISLHRYMSILDSEILFYKKFKTELYKQYKRQLMKRVVKQVIMVKNKQIALYTIKKLLNLA